MQTDTIRQKLGSLRSRLRLLAGTGGLLRVVATLAGIVAVSFALDWLFQLPWGARLVMLLIGIGVALHAIWSNLIAPARVAMSDESLALLVESRHPEFRDQLISALQLEKRLQGDDRGESRAMMEATVAEARSRFSDVSFSDAVSARGMARPAFFGIAGLLLVALYSAALPHHADLWVKRCLLLKDEPWPPRTQLEVRITNIEQFRHEIRADQSMDLYVPENSAIPVTVFARGEIPASVTILKYKLPREENPNPISIEMPSRGEGEEFEYKFGRVVSSFEFAVQGGDDRDEKPYFRVFVRSAPRISSFSVDYDYPDYVNATGREDRSGVREYNVVGPEGTAVTMNFETSSAVRRFEFIRNETETLVLEPVDDRRRRFVWKDTLDRDGFYTYRMIGENGTPSREAPNFNFGAQTDLPPTIGLVMPEITSVDVSAAATVPLSLEVGDDYRVGELSLRWDRDRDGAFAASWDLSQETLREESEGRELEAFVALQLEAFEIIEEGAKRAARPGDTIYLRVSARDTRSTAANPEPNETVYPSLIALNVREPAELERELLRGQIRAKEQIERAQVAVSLKLEEMASLRKSEAKIEIESLHGFVAAQSLVTSSLSEATRGFVRIFDGHLFNRTDPSNLTEALIAKIIEEHRRGGATHYEHLRAVLPEERARFDESEPMGKLARIMDLMIQSADKLSPEVGDRAKTAIDARDDAGRAQAFAQAYEAQSKLNDVLLSLLEKMEEWEDFQDVIQSLKDILDLQRGLSDRMESISK
jgi:hypothetical protein